MIEVSEKENLRKLVRDARKSGMTIGLVPTMGCLHEGHLSLVRKSVEDCDYTVVSIFVNPAQFGPKEDLNKYPRVYEQDKLLLENLGVDCIYYPTEESMYPNEFSTWVIEDRISNVLCGKSRPGHFKGVLTIVAKLFNLVQPDFVYFGRKDFQQALLIQKMVDELDFPCKIVACPIVREEDGLAMSSRNQYLSETERAEALLLSKTLFMVEESFLKGEKKAETLIDVQKRVLNGCCSENFKLEYFEILDPETLERIETVGKSALVAIAGQVGATRLIDNVLLEKIEMTKE
ncbi:pantoate--beta-alanine ligase [bacterium]|nr:pantoate--beta-alanine ligase [bacterium]MBU1024917.1 pantoate--beta-alanine ligase [bacterium]